MSESLEIVEITDSSIITDTSPELKSSSALQNTTKTKRQLDDSGELPDERASKKICTELDETVEITQQEIEDVPVDDSVLSSTAICESELVVENEFDLNILDKSDDLLVETTEEIVDETTELIPDDSELEKSNEEEAEAEESFIEAEEMAEEEEDEENEGNSSDDDYDESLMAGAIQAAAKCPLPPANYQLDDDGTIALDDSDDDEPTQQSRDSSEFSINNDVTADSDDEKQEREALRKIRLPKPHVRLARNLVKKAYKFLALRKLEGKRTTEQMLIEKKETPEKVVESKPEETLKSPAAATPLEAPSNEASSKDSSIAKNGKPHEDEMMEVSGDNKSLNSTVEEKKALEKASETTEKENNQTDSLKVDEIEERTIEPDEPMETETSRAAEKITEKPSENSRENSSDSSRHESSLLIEIAKASTEEIFNRYVVKTTDQSPTLDEFSEELFYCLQLNNIEIEKAKQLWNEKLHIKYKIRELMETIRRHRAVIEIEAFGYKPENSGSNSHRVNSSKSSTTTSETDNYEKHSKMSTESVNRLIQDVRASMLKRDDKLRNEELASGSNAVDRTLASQWNNLQSSTGRQGQIVDVQSIIDDFRQKNPQEIPRRGRRMKNTFDNNYFDGQPEEARSLRKDFMSNVNMNSNDFSSSMKTSSGYPEVSLHPVQSLYKNLSNTSGPSNLGVHRSSLLQSILTKQSTKNPSGFHQNQQQLPSTSTLARLLTAPERSFQGAQKHTSQPPPRQSSSKSHNNGEITITPIGGLSNSRNKDFPMDDDENSLEPPLVIDEAEDFDASDRSNVKSVSDLLCQGCKKNKAFFMCAGCSRQWYCSKECQEMAWDDHAESCMT